MRNLLRFLLICALTLIPRESLFSQWIPKSADTLVDVFPLSVGNQWTYRYHANLVAWPSGNPGTITTDTGRVVYLISGRRASEDSTSWLIRATRDLVRHMVISYMSEPDRDSTYAICDTSYFDLVESHQGPHQVYRNVNPYLIRLDVFPFTREYVDTTMICRYREVGEGDTTTFLSWICPLQPFLVSVFTFRQGIGLIRNSYNSGTVDFSQENEHVLLSAIITSLPGEVKNPQPSSIYLYQNYPNPFNPATCIKYELSRSSIVRLSIYDLLGREAALLVDGKQEAGVHEVVFDARLPGGQGSGLSSGVYVYRLAAGTAVQSRKLLLLR